MKAKVDNSVRLNRSKAEPIEFNVELPRLVNPPASWQMKLPVICWGPSMLIMPEASGPTRRSPWIVAQLAYWVASAWELIVAVGWEQREEPWAAKKDVVSICSCRLRNESITSR